MIKNSLIFILFTTISIAGGIFHNDILFFIVSKIGLSWLITSILIRILVIVFFAIAVHRLIKIFKRFRNAKFIYVLLICLLPGFGISFITPIYVTDYGDFSDDFKLNNITELENQTNSKLLPETGYALVAFFSTTCPFCKEESKKLGTNIDAGQKITVNAIFPGTDEDTKKFLEENKGEKFNYFLLDNDPLFIDLSGGTFPSLFLIDSNGETIKHWQGDALNYSSLDYLKSL